mmetsp:Transcript_7458/g.18496  ORF Transcript_7458/g.18496 Transcript_7458/m.18496 type:complete len:601 (+) Transcript_7458:68-1870(+)
MATDDPFACFGDDGDEDDDDSHVDSDSGIGCNEPINQPYHSNAKTPVSSANRDRARHLIDTYNANKNEDNDHSSSSDPTTSITSSQSKTPFRSSYEDQRLRTSSLPWPHCPPLYLGPMDLISVAEGGGRGYIAAQDLPPGTCVLIEEPLVKGWSDRQMGRRLGLESIQHLLQMDDAKKIVECMEELHPSKEKVLGVLGKDDKEGESLATIDPLDRTQIVDMISDMNSNEAYIQQVQELVMYAKERSITNSDGSSVDDRDINRLLLTLRYNGFDSGLYLHFSMFNHNEDPNCIKFRPSNYTGTKALATQEDGYYSEARTTRHVRKGEALTLHYLENPREVSHATRRKILWDQHRFDIGDEYAYKQFLDVTVVKTGHLFNDNERANQIFQSELVRGSFPPSNREGSINEESDLPTTFNIEKSLDDLEDILVELQAIVKMQIDNDGTVYFDRAAALELTIWELITASQSTLENNLHILLSRCWRLHLDVIELLLSHCSTMLTEKQSVELMSRFIPSVYALLDAQRRRLGGDHPDVARSYNDFSMGLQALLSHSPKRLFSLQLDGLSTLDQCSKMEHNCRNQKKRIEDMFPRDVDVLLDSVKRK